MMTMWTVLGVLVAMAVIVIALVVRTSRRRGLSSASKAMIEKALQQAVSQSDPVRRVLAVDTVLDLALTELGFVGSLGDKLKKAGPRMPTIQAVWDAHKLRNRLAHEHDASVHPSEVDRAVRVLEHAIRSLSR